MRIIMSWGPLLMANTHDEECSTPFHEQLQYTRVSEHH